jgi:hypothetical protein
MVNMTCASLLCPYPRPARPGRSSITSLKSIGAAESDETLTMRDGALATIVGSSDRVSRKPAR